jgi:hypothetical protein
MGIQAIIIIGWRSDAGAYQVDAFPPETDIDPQDLMNLFSLHRMGANNDLSKAVANFNFLRVDQGLLISWYSGFQSTRYIAKPNFCVTLLADLNENANKWEMPLEIITHNLLSKLENPNFHTILGQYLGAIQKGYRIDPVAGFVSQYDEAPSASASTPAQVPAPVPAPPPSVAAPIVTPSSVSSSSKGDFDDLMDLVEPDSAAVGGSDPFAASGSDPFGTGSPSKDPFAGPSPFASTSSPSPQAAPTSSGKPMTASATNYDPHAMSKAIVMELEKIDRGIPQRPNTDNADLLVKFLEKKVAFLESKIGILSKLVQGLQAKETELSEKNELIGKLLLLFS